MKRRTNRVYADNVTWQFGFSGERVPGQYQLWHDNGSVAYITGPHENVDTLIAEWIDEPTGPVRTRTVTVTEIVVGKYGRLHIEGDAKGFASVALTSKSGARTGEHFSLDVAELRAAAAVFVQLADALDGTDE